VTVYYTQVPTLEMRVAASTLVIIGVVGKVVRSQVDHYDGEAFVRSTYEVTVNEVLKGMMEQRVIHVEVLGGEAEKAVTPLSLPMQIGASLVLMLVPQDDDAFVPYFTSAFLLNSDGQISLGSQAAETLSSEVAPIKGDNITLETLRALIKTVFEMESATTKAAESVMTGQALPPVLEMPQGFNGGGEPSEPQAYEQNSSSN
jgi:hypothetical protein